MAKDPAFLFYPGDWLQGTMGMTFEEKGAYLELLIFQFNKGKFTQAQAKQVLCICSASVFENVLQKFDTDGTFFWKQRLSEEIERRHKFSESRKKNARGSKNKDSSKKEEKAYAKHMETETETENKDEYKEEKGVVGEKENQQFSDGWFSEIFDELLVESIQTTFPKHNLEEEFKIFKLKVRGSPDDYIHRDTGGIRQAFIYQLKNSKSHANGNGTKKQDRRSDAVLKTPKDWGEF